MKKWNERTTQLAVIIAEKMCRLLLPDTRRCRGRVTKLELELVYSGQCNTMADAIAKDAFIDALGDKKLDICVMEREPKSLEKAFKIAERMELYARKVKP